MKMTALLVHLKTKGGLHGATLNIAIDPKGDFAMTFVQVVIDKGQPKVAGMQLDPSLLNVIEAPPLMVSTLCKAVRVSMPKEKS